MHILISLASILLTVLIGAMSPRPSFLTVARTAMSESRQNGIATAAGMGSGGAIFAILAMLGLKTVFKAFPLIYMVLKLIGGIYLIYIGIRIWQGAKKPVIVQSEDSENKNTWMHIFAAGSPYHASTKP